MKKYKPRHDRSEHKPTPKGRFIGIHFGDHHYASTVKTFLGLFRDSYWVTYYYDAITKEQIAKLFNEITYGIHFIGESRDFRDEKEVLYREYLKIDLNHVFLGQECIDQVTTNSGGYDGTFHYVDLDQGMIFSA